MTADLQEYHRLFELGKAEVNKGLARGQKTPLLDGALDDGIRELVCAMNKLPFLYTTASCAGIIGSRFGSPIFTPSPDGAGGSYLLMPPDANVLFWPGYVDFVLYANEPAMRFKGELEHIVSRSRGATIEPGPPLMESNDPELRGLTLWVGFAKAAPNKKCPPLKGPILPYAEAIRRDGYKRAFMSELWALTMKYLPL